MKAKPITRISKNTRPLHNNSYLTALTIIENNDRDVLNGRALAYDEMRGRYMLGNEQIRDSHITEIRAEIERRFDGASEEKGLKLSFQDIYHAIVQVADRNRFHPVREYLTALTWDGVPRLDHAVDDLLDAERTEINQTIVRKFFISAVARPLNPGVKVDTVLILVGPQGVGKSSFFTAIASPWIVDSPIDIHSKDAFQVARAAWIVELAELESLRRAKDASAIKAHLTSSVDTYRASYGKFVTDVPRTYVFVGTTNADEFLADETGNRRFWPLRVGNVDLKRAEQQRDQLWAEAVDAFRKGEPWWLTAEQEAQLGTVHEAHRVRDAWETPILAWADGQLVPFTTADVLAKAIEKPAGQWTKNDEMRVAATLKANGWERKTDPDEKHTKKWRKKVSK